MRLAWDKWGWEFARSVGRHVGTAGMTWIALGMKEGKVDWHDLWIAILAGGILPSVFTFLQSTPVPPDEEETTVKPKEI